MVVALGVAGVATPEEVVGAEALMVAAWVDKGVAEEEAWEV